MVTSLAAKEPLNGLTTSNGLRTGLAGFSQTLSRMSNRGFWDHIEFVVTGVYQHGSFERAQTH